MARVFNGPQIRKLIKDDQFLTSMNQLKANVWTSFVSVIKNFLGNHKAENYVELVDKMHGNFKQLNVNMCIKMHFLYSHLDNFPENLGNVSDKQGKMFHQDMRVMDERYQGRWDAHMTAHYCLNIACYNPNLAHKRRSLKRSFIPANHV